MPWLSTLHPFGDTSPLTRFVIGLDEALRDYRGSDEACRWVTPANRTIHGTRTFSIAIFLSRHRSFAKRKMIRSGGGPAAIASRPASRCSPDRARAGSEP